MYVLTYITSHNSLEPSPSKNKQTNTNNPPIRLPSLDSSFSLETRVVSIDIRPRWLIGWRNHWIHNYGSVCGQGTAPEETLFVVCSTQLFNRETVMRTDVFSVRNSVNNGTRTHQKACRSMYEHTLNQNKSLEPSPWNNKQTNTNNPPIRLPSLDSSLSLQNQSCLHWHASAMTHRFKESLNPR